MNAPDQIGTDGIMHRPVAGDPGHRRKGRRGYGNTKMAFAAFLVSGVAPVGLTFILDVQFGGLERFFQSGMDFIAHGHFSAISPSLSDPNL